jgi:hypothetical protein
VAETIVTIRRTGTLDGNVVARSINVEKGGTFYGQLVIGAKKTWEQGELIPDVESTEPRTTGTLRRPPSYPFGSPVTSQFCGRCKNCFRAVLMSGSVDTSICRD